MEEPAAVTSWMQKRLRIMDDTVVLDLGSARPWAATLLMAGLGVLAVLGTAGTLVLMQLVGNIGFLIGLPLMVLPLRYLWEKTIQRMEPQRLVLSRNGVEVRSGLFGRVATESWSGLGVEASARQLQLQGAASHEIRLTSAPLGAAEATAHLLCDHADDPIAALRRLEDRADSAHLHPFARPTADGMQFELSPVQRPLSPAVLGTFGVATLATVGLAVAFMLDPGTGLAVQVLSMFACIAAFLGLSTLAAREALGKRPVNVEMTIDAARLVVTRTHALGWQTQWSCAISTIERVDLVGKTLRVQTSTETHAIPLTGRSHATVDEVHRRIVDRVERVQQPSRPEDVPEQLGRLTQRSAQT